MKVSQYLGGAWGYAPPLIDGTAFSPLLPRGLGVVCRCGGDASNQFLSPPSFGSNYTLVVAWLNVNTKAPTINHPEASTKRS